MACYIRSDKRVGRGGRGVGGDSSLSPGTGSRIKNEDPPQPYTSFLPLFIGVAARKRLKTTDPGELWFCHFDPFY